MKTVIIAMFLALVFCGQLKAQEKVSSDYLPEQGKNEYIISIPSLGTGNQFVSGDWIGWEKIDVTEEADGTCHFKVTAFNGPILFYWSDYKKPWNKIMKDCPGYHPQTGCIKLYLFDGNVYTTPPEVKLPGDLGDHLIRWTNHGDGTVTVFFNNAALEAGSSKPFVMHSANKWIEIPQIITDASGWGKVTVVVKNNQYQDRGVDTNSFLGVGYGAYKGSEKVYPATILTSSWLNSDSTGFKIPLK